MWGGERMSRGGEWHMGDETRKCTHLVPYLGTRPPRELVQRNTSVCLSLLSPPISPGASTRPRTKDRYSVKVADTSSKLLECFDTSSSRRARVDLNFLQGWIGLVGVQRRLLALGVRGYCTCLQPL